VVVAVVVAVAMAVDWGFSRRVAAAVAAAAWLGYPFLLSWMDEGFSRLFLGVNVQ